LDVHAMLAALDSARGRAYARREPRLLAGVYASARLVQRDRAQLLAIVPPHCALHGLHSIFEAVRVTSRKPAVVQLQAQVSVAAARLTCAGMSPTSVRPSASAALRITLVRRGGRYLIAAEHRVRGAAPSAGQSRGRDARTRSRPW
jgi:hypothetical protein